MIYIKIHNIDILIYENTITLNITKESNLEFIYILTKKLCNYDKYIPLSIYKIKKSSENHIHRIKSNKISTLRKIDFEDFIDFIHIGTTYSSQKSEEYYEKPLNAIEIRYFSNIDIDETLLLIREWGSNIEKLVEND